MVVDESPLLVPSPRSLSDEGQSVGFARNRRYPVPLSPRTAALSLFRFEGPSSLVKGGSQPPSLRDELPERPGPLSTSPSADEPHEDGLELPSQQTVDGEVDARVDRQKHVTRHVDESEGLQRIGDVRQEALDGQPQTKQ